MLPQRVYGVQPVIPYTVFRASHRSIATRQRTAACGSSRTYKDVGDFHATCHVFLGDASLHYSDAAAEMGAAVAAQLDGTARGGAVISVVDELGIPIKFLGVGEKVVDLQPFDAQGFVDALFPAVEQVALSG